MAVTYVTINRENYAWFGWAAIVSGVLGFVSIGWFDRLRKAHVVSVPQVGPDGTQLLDERGNKLSKNVIIGSEAQLRPEAATALKEARERHGGVWLRVFMSGFGHKEVNDPEALWDRDLLAGIGNRVTMSLMYVLFLAVITLFLAAFVIEVGSRSPS